MPIIGKHHVHPYRTPFFSIAIIGGTSRWDANHALPLPRTGNRLADQHLPHACFRPTSPQRFWFRGLWRKPGQRFAVCGGNPAFKQDAAVALQKRAPANEPEVFAERAPPRQSSRSWQTHVIRVVGGSACNFVNAQPAMSSA